MISFLLYAVIYLIYLVFIFPKMITQKSAVTPFLSIVFLLGGFYLFFKFFLEAKKEIDRNK